jgi:hypothetical protein
MLIEDHTAAALPCARSRAVRHDFRWEPAKSAHRLGVSCVALGLSDPAVSGGGTPPLMLRASLFRPRP